MEKHNLTYYRYIKMLRKSFFLIFLIILSLFSCATSKPYNVWNPWVRLLKSEENIETSTNLLLDVQGSQKCIPGRDELVKKQIRNNLKETLMRRGFTMNKDTDHSYTAVLHYYTQPYNKNELTEKIGDSRSLSTGISRLIGTSLASYIAPVGLGVNLSRYLTPEQKTEPDYSYTHITSLEFINRENSLTLKGDVIWHSF